MFEIPPCPFSIGQHVTFVEDQDRPESLGRGIIVGFSYQPGHWRLTGWVVQVLAYTFSISTWMDGPIEEELHETSLRPCNEEIPPWAIDLLRGTLGIGEPVCPATR